MIAPSASTAACFDVSGVVTAHADFTSGSRSLCMDTVEFDSFLVPEAKIRQYHVTKAASQIFKVIGLGFLKQSTKMVHNEKS